MNADVVRSFFEVLFADTVTAESQLVLWRSKSQPAIWAPSLDDAVAGVQALGDGAYFSVCLHDPEAALAHATTVQEAKPEKERKVPDLGNTRGFPESVTFVPGLWLDVDVAVEGKKKPYPATRDKARELVDRLPAKVSLLVWTGGGFHAYWLFDEPVKIEGDDQRERLRKLCYGWHVLATDEARRQGKTIDNVSDLSRVLRPVGTVNPKYDSEVVLVPLHDGYEPRYGVDGLEMFIPENLELPERAAVLDSQDSRFTLNPDAQPPLKKILALRDLGDDKFDRTWRHDRGDGPDALASHSEYDLALANYFVDVGFTDQEIVDALVWHRAEHGGKPKYRVDYYRDRIRLARANKIDEARGREVAAALETIEVAGKEIGAGMTTPANIRPEVIAGINTMLCLQGEQEVAAILRMPGDPPIYALEMVEGQILTLGKVGAIINGATFRESIASLTGKLIPQKKAARWNPIAQAILAAAIEVPVETPAKLLGGLLLRWLHSVDIFEGAKIKDRSMAVSANRPFFYRLHKRSGVAFDVSDFLLWLRDYRGELFKRTEVRLYFRSLGVETDVRVAIVRRTAKAGVSTAGVWWVPRAVIERLSGSDLSLELDQEDNDAAPPERTPVAFDAQEISEDAAAENVAQAAGETPQSERPSVGSADPRGLEVTT